MDNPMTVEEAAQEVGVTTAAVRLALAEGRVAGRKHATVWMVDRASVQAWKARRERKEAAA